MKNIDLKGNPFYLNDEQIKWVEDTRDKLTTEEKIGQLFFLMGFTTKEKELREVVRKIRPGGMMYRTTTAKKVTAAHRALQSESDIPMLLAANLEAGGDGLVEEGTFYGNQMMVAASDHDENAYRLGLVAGREAASVGGNMAFAPIIDINYNFRNPITNTRSFGDDPDRVARMGAAYVKGAHEAGLSVTIKHFPGDGTDARDQHLLTTHNNLSYGDWMDTFGKAYKTSIEAGARGLMVGHISLASYFDEVVTDNNELREQPATLNPVLLNKLLREELGYNGLTMTDASLMAGFGEKGKREDLVPASIAAGCDMFLFTRMPEDDYRHMMEGYRKGIITEERLNEAVTRILAIKASLKIHNKSAGELVPGSFSSLDREEHRKWSAELADQAVTLVRDDQGILPLKPGKNKRIGILYNGNEGGMAAVFKNLPGFRGFMIRSMMRLAGGKKELKPYEHLVNRLKAKGFDAFFYNFGDILTVMKDMTGRTLDEWAGQFDAVIYLTKWETMSNQTSLQLQYKALGFDAPWFVHEIPTIHVSLGSPYHGYDLPMVPTHINAYGASDHVYDAVVNKLTGSSSFKGVSPVRLDFKEFTGNIK